MYDNSVFFSAWAMSGRRNMGRLCQCCGLFWFWNGDDCGTFPKMGYCVRIEGSVVSGMGLFGEAALARPFWRQPLWQCVIFLLIKS